MFQSHFSYSTDQRKKSHTKFPQVSQAPNLTDSPALRRSLFSNIPPTSQCVLIYAIPHVTSYCSNCCFLDLSYFLFFSLQIDAYLLHHMIIIEAQFSQPVVVSLQFQSTSCSTTRCLPTS